MNKEVIGKMICIAFKAKEQYYDSVMECSIKKGLTKQEIDILVVLDSHPECSRAIDMVNVRGLSKAYVSKALSSLEQKGMISIDTDDNDHRYQCIKLEERAYEIVKYMRNSQKKMIEKLTRELSNEDKDVFIRVITTMFNNMMEDENNV